MIILEFSTNNDKCTARQLIPTKRKRNPGAVVMNPLSKKYSYKPSPEYERYLAQVKQK
jgi:hypothetical protein